MTMRLFAIYRTGTTKPNQYHSAVVASHTNSQARMIHPDAMKNPWDGKADDSWCEPAQVRVVQIGMASPCIKAGVVMASFHGNRMIG